jgi:2-(1,2-epoxy-1,2-dihydrophenyl)acetyl-CoA isomerase
VAEDRGLRAVVLTGTSKVFCAGADLGLAERLRQPAFGRWWLESHNRAMLALAQIPQPAIAAVNGAAAGAGFNLALACDFVVAADIATFVQAFVRIGLATDMGSLFLLPRRVGHQRARELMYSGRVLNAEEALAIGAVDEVVEVERLVSRAADWATELAGAPTVALSAIKRGLGRSEASSLADSLQIEAELQMDVFASRDFAQGTTAFLEKRPARFTGA